MKNLFVFFVVLFSDECTSKQSHIYIKMSPVISVFFSPCALRLIFKKNKLANR